MHSVVQKAPTPAAQHTIPGAQSSGPSHVIAKSGGEGHCEGLHAGVAPMQQKSCGPAHVVSPHTMHVLLGGAGTEQALEGPASSAGRCDQHRGMPPLLTGAQYG